MSQKLGRMDFHMEAVGKANEDGHIQMRLVPNPERYTFVEHEGEACYLDKFLSMLIPVTEMAKQAAGLPIYELSPSIGPTKTHAATRRNSLKNELLSGVHTQPIESARPHAGLSVGSSARNLAFLSVDICGSTLLRQVDNHMFDKGFDIFIRELGTLVGQFNGTLLKVTGDGFIAYIDHPAFTRVCDNIVDLGCSVLVMMKDAINPILNDIGLSDFQVRAGADFGTAVVSEFFVPATGFKSTDISSDALNRAVKIQESCEEGQFRIGRDLYELVHTQWLKRAHEVGVNLLGQDGYKLYGVR